jgi:hypothetical protein
MQNLDVELYVSQLYQFFEKNPNDLMDLIGESDKDEFYELVRAQCTENIEKGDEVSLTQDQIIDIVIRLKKKDLDESKMTVIVDKVFQHTKFGLIGLN